MDKQFPHFQKYDNNEMKNRANQAGTVNIRDILCEKLQNKFAKIRSERMNSIFKKRISQLSNENSENSMEQDTMDNDEIIVDNYLKKISQEFSDENLKYEYELKALTDNHISFCPICFYPVLSIANIVTCVNNCFEFHISKEYVNNNYTLDNFMDEFMNIRKEHMNCNSEINYFLFQDKIMLYCVKCFKNDLNL